MVLSFRVTFTILLLLSGSSTLALAVFAYRHRTVPGALAFAALAASLSYWSFVYAVGIQITGDPTLRIQALQIQWLAHPAVPLSLFLFGLSYTGHDQLLTRRTVPIFAAIPAVVVAAAWTNPWHQLLWTDQTVHVVDNMAVLVPTYGPLFWINIVYGYGIEFVAIAVLVRLIYTSDYLYTDQSALLLIGITVPLAANVFEIFVVGATPAVDYTPVTFAVSGLAFGYAVFRRQLFDLIPATRTLGRNEAIGQLDTGIVIVDDDDRVVYANPSAGDIFDTDPSEMLGRQARSFVDDEWLHFDAEDALAEVERGDRTYEVRTSEITDRQDRPIGNTLVIHDVTVRKRRERELAAKRDELETINELNAVIRSVNQALVSATSRAEIERTICERLADADLYRGVCVGDVETWTGEAGRWRIAGEALAPGRDEPADGGLDVSPPELAADELRTGDADDADALPAPAAGDAAATNWIVVPVAYGRTVYGAIGLLTDRTAVSDEERSILRELGELVGHSINAVESRRLFGAEDVVELSIDIDGCDDPLAAASAATGTRLTVVGVIPRSGEGHQAFLTVTDGSAAAVREHLADEDLAVELVRESGDGGLLKLPVDESVSLSPVVASDAHLLQGGIAGGQATYDVLVPSADDGRTLLDRFASSFPSTDLRSKRNRDHPFEDADGVTPERLDDLTDRQREALEAAFRAGYFEWPRDADAEAVAESMDISSPTLHSHLRKAQQTLFEDVFEAELDS